MKYITNIIIQIYSFYQGIYEKNRRLDKKKEQQEKKKDEKIQKKTLAYNI